MTISTLTDAGTRSFWAAIIPFGYVVIYLATLPLIRKVQNVLPSYWFFLEEAESLVADGSHVGAETTDVPLRRTLLLSAVSLIECAVWVSLACYVLVANPDDEVLLGVCDSLVAVTWLYAGLRAVLRPPTLLPYDLLVLFSLHLILSTVVLVGLVYDLYVFELPISPLLLLARVTNVAVITVLLGVVLSFPLALPSTRIRKEDIGTTVSPEAYPTAWDWITFRWIVPLLDLGSTKTLDESDVWPLTPLMRARALHARFSRTTGRLVKRLWAAHWLELVLDFVLWYASIGLNYAGPFFLKRILDALADPTHDREKRALAFVYAVLAFLATTLKAEMDVQRLWLSRRAGGRVRSELMAAVYEKALKRKDLSGATGERVSDGSADAPGKQAGKPASGADIGKIVNLMSGDASTISQTVATLYLIYGGPFEILVASLFLYKLLGLSAFTGYVVLVLSWPLNTRVGKSSIQIQKGLSAARDKRMGVCNELISAIKLIKFFAWEERWIKRVSDARTVELQWLVKARLNSLHYFLIWTSVTVLVPLSSFTVFVALGHELTVGTAFTAIALFQMLRGPFNGVPTMLVQLMETKVALDRIASFLDEEEVDQQASTLKKGSSPQTVEESGVKIIDGTFRWNRSTSKSKDTPASASQGTTPASSATSDSTDGVFELKDINVTFPEGRLTLVTGPTASGKTALLMALLGELTTIHGHVVMSKDPSKVDEHGLTHTISYAAQMPWLRHATIRENILFGYPWDEERYNAVVECCALKPDLAIFEDGDLTEIGARGISLSGGQKARVALARAIYVPTKYVLLDDPLSAVDSHTARFLYEKLFRGPLLANRTVILVTHHVELMLPGADYLVRMADGRIEAQGFVSELRASGQLGDFANADPGGPDGPGDASRPRVKEVDMEPAPAAESDADEGEEASQKAKKPRKLVEEEHRASGNVKWPIYKTYLKAASYWTWVALLTLIFLTQMLGLGEKLWIKVWGEAYGDAADALHLPTGEGQGRNYDSLPAFSQQAPLQMSDVGSNAARVHLPPAQDHPFFYVGVYAAITMSAGLVNVLGMATQFSGALRASRVLFSRLLQAVVRATMRWHDVTPQGRMLNRFSKDISTIDTSLARSLHSVNLVIASFAVSVLTIISIFPLAIIPAVILGYFYRRVGLAYLNTGRDIQRLESNSRSPIFAHFSELLEGVVTVRAFGAERRFLEEMYDRIDLAIRMWYIFWMMNRWVLLMFDTLGAAATLATTLFALAGYVDAGLAGVCITSAMSFTQSVYWTCRNWTALELDLNSVERVVEYLELPQEPPAIIESNRPPAYWPTSSGTNKELLVVEDLVIRYAPELPAVLHGVSFALQGGERVGLLGRTGSGKSTLAMSLLRFVEPSAGRIIVDGIDIATIGLYDLRSRITFIPQDAVLFSGTIRDNLDPFGDHSDHECWDVLRRVQLVSESHPSSLNTSRTGSRAASHQAASDMDVSVSTATAVADAQTRVNITLDTEVSPGGANFSQGQRQLIALARALLRRSPIVVLDEATSSIDFATDAKIQRTIREEFRGSLLLTVAHRLRTVIDYDRLIVLDEGRVVEFDTPANLIRKPDSVFRSMCLKSGYFAELEAAVAVSRADNQ
ncbi:hypothetical protein C8Q77DRAFT_1056057 [Trametes polyzona]|nr:hypothetical protein C8Q77DRAFT_1056057 [Trametes polyzona]